MIINKQKQAGLNFGEFQKNRIIKERYSGIDAAPISVEAKEDAKNRILQTVSDEGSMLYLLTQSVVVLADRVKIDLDKFDFKYLSKLPERKVTFLLGNKFFRWYKTPNKINVVAVFQQEIAKEALKYYPQGVTHDVAYVFFSFDTEIGAISFPPNPHPPFNFETAVEFLKLLVFTEFSPIENKVLFPNQKIGTRREGNYKNESNNKVIIVDSTWNTNIILTKEFLVSGHFRWQKFGKNFSQVKLTWISTFKKDGYHKGAKKLNN